MDEEMKSRIERNLRDTGLTKTKTELFFTLDGKKQMNLLSQHRAAILRRIHNDEKRLDALDYLVHVMEERV